MQGDARQGAHDVRQRADAIEEDPEARKSGWRDEDAVEGDDEGEEEGGDGGRGLGVGQGGGEEVGEGATEYRTGPQRGGCSLVMVRE